jgi:hypothetical protein
VPAYASPVQVDSPDIDSALALVLAELTQKLEPADISALATAARQDSAKSVLDAMATSLTTLGGYTDGIESALTVLAGHVDGLETLAIALNGYVDGLEGKDFATQTTLAATLAAVDTLEALIGALTTKLTDGSARVGGTSLVDTATGTFAYAAGTAAGTVDVPAGAKLREVTVLAGASVGATVTIGGGNTITVVAGGAFTATHFGATVNLDVVIGGTVQAYYVGWTT